MHETRRKLLALALAAAAQPRLAFPQSTPQRRIIGLLSLVSRDKAQVGKVLRRLEALGQPVGAGLVLEARYAANEVARLPELARELVALQPAVIIAGGLLPALALQKATQKIPIVMWGVPTPAAAGLVASLARPGANITGTSYFQPDIAGKMLEVLRAALPQVTRIAYVWDPAVPGQAEYNAVMQRTTARVGIAVTDVPVSDARPLSIDVVARSRPQAIVIANYTTLRPKLPPLLQYAAHARIPTLGTSRALLETGITLAVGPDMLEMEQNVADLVDRVLRGSAPAAMAVREPSRYEVVVNRKAADAIGLVLRKELLLIASEVVE